MSGFAFDLESPNLVLGLEGLGLEGLCRGSGLENPSIGLGFVIFALTTSLQTDLLWQNHKVRIVNFSFIALINR
jgi:hypothetical protein